MDIDLTQLRSVRAYHQPTPRHPSDDLYARDEPPFGQPATSNQQEPTQQWAKKKP